MMNKKIEQRVDLKGLRVIDDRIKELAEKAGCSIDNLGYGEGNLHQFAEFLLMECIEIVEQDLDINAPKAETDDKMRIWVNAQLTFSEVIKTLFGIEELNEDYPFALSIPRPDPMTVENERIINFIEPLRESKSVLVKGEYRFNLCAYKSGSKHRFSPGAKYVFRFKNEQDLNRFKEYLEKDK